MKRFSVWRRCISIKTFQHSATALLPPPFFRKPHKQSTWQTASITSFHGTLQSTLRTIADQMDSVCLQSIVRRVFFDQVVKVLFTLIKAILSCHPIWMRVKQLRNHTSQQSNWHRPWPKFFKMSPSIDSTFLVTQSVPPGNQFLRAYNWNWLKFQTLDEWILKLYKNWLNQL